MSCGLTVFDKTVQKSVEWIKQLQEDLHVEKREDAYEVMRGVLYALRDRLPPNEAVELGAQLPMAIRGMYYEGWRIEGKPVKMDRQQFLERIDSEMNRQRQERHDPVRICRAVFGLLDRFIAPGEMNDVRDNLPGDMRDLWESDQRKTQGPVPTQREHKEQRLSVEEIMERRVRTVAAESPVKTAADLMKKMDIGAIPVQAQNRIAGIVTDRDITVRMVAEGKDPSRTQVSDIMTRGVYTCYNDDDARQVSETMEKEKVRRVIVVDHQNNLVGIVSLADMALRLGRTVGGEILSRVSAPGKAA